MTTWTRRQACVAVGACAAWPHGALRAEPGVDAGEIRIGQSITLQGGRNAYGMQVLSGVRTFVDALNRQGGVGGRRLVLTTLDDDNRAAQAEANARKLVGDGHFILFGSVEGGPSTAVMKVAGELGVPFFGPMAGSPGLRRPHQPLVFPVRAEHREEFRALIDYGRRTGLSKVALFHAATDVGREHLENVRKLCTEAGVGFAGGAAFRPDIDDAGLDAVVAALQRQGADLVLNHGSAGVYGRLVRRARAGGFKASFWGVNSGSALLAAELGELAHGMVFAQIVPNPLARKTAIARELQAAWQAAHMEGVPTHGSLEGYLTAKALARVLARLEGPPTRRGLVEALERFDEDLGGVRVRYAPGEHTGSTFVDLAMVGRDGRFVQ